MQYSDFIGLAGAPVITGLVEVFVKPFITDDRFYPVAAVLLGLIWNVGIAVSTNTDIVLSVLVGIATGLAAAGFYSATTRVVSTVSTIVSAIRGNDNGQ